MPPKRLVSPTGKDMVLPAVRANAGLQARMQKRLDQMIAAMNADTTRTVRAAWKAKPPTEVEMAEDETAAERNAYGKSAAMNLRDVMAKLTRKWTSRFDTMAEEMARYFSTAAFERGTNQMRDILARAGFTVPMKLTSAVNDALQATIGEQVGLIKSIPQQYLGDVTGAVMRSVTAGRDLASLTVEIQQKYGIARRRAETISRDQNNKATATITQARQQELGIDTAIWMHSHAGRRPRPEHVAADGKKYKVGEGLYLEGVWTVPGREVNCRCFSKSVIAGFS